MNERKSAVTVFFMIAATFLSKLLGMLRGVFMAARYGTGIESEAFAAASKIPLTFFDLLLGAAILGCFIPVYNSFGEGREQRADEFASTFLNGVILLTGLLAFLGMVFAEPLLVLLTPKLNAEAARLAVSLLRILFPMIAFTGSAYVLVGVLQSKGSFLVPSLISVCSNGVIILYFLLLDDKFQIQGLAFAYLVAWLSQLLILIGPLVKKKFHYTFSLKLRTPEMKRALSTVFPIMAGSWLSPAGILIGAFFAPFTAVPGAVAVFDYSNNLFIIISGVLTYGICNFIFPTLSRLAGNQDDEEYKKAVRTSLSSMLFIIIPIAAAVAVLAPAIVCAVYQRGDFDAVSSFATASALAGFAPAIVGFSFIEILNRVFYSRGKTSRPVYAALIGIAVNISLCAVSVVFAGERGLGSIFPLSLANSIGLLCAAVYLTIQCAREVRGVFDRRFLINCVKVVLAGAISLAVMVLITAMLHHDPYAGGFFINLFHCLVVFLPGIIVFLSCCALFRTEQAAMIKKMLWTKGHSSK